MKYPLDQRFIAAGSFPGSGEEFAKGNGYKEDEEEPVGAESREEVAILIKIGLLDVYMNRTIIMQTFRE